jgi:hypothetical protein
VPAEVDALDPQRQDQLRESRGARSRSSAFADTVSARNDAGTTAAASASWSA